MLASRRSGPTAGSTVSLRETLVAAGLRQELADELDRMPQKVVQVDPRRPFRESGIPRDEVVFVRSGILSKFKVDSSGRRQIVALRFPGEGILPREGMSSYGIQAVVPSEILVGDAEDFNAIVEKYPELHKFFWQLTQRNENIGYEWLVNCGRRDSTARVAHLLCETAVRSRTNVPEEPLHNPFTQQQIAEITGQTSVNVNRVMADLERQGLIERHGRDILFRDWSEMRRVASFQPSYLE
ncbi:Crp/Fnr family transcriptional regulator [Sphingomonas sp. SM33]|jgi:CRP-like cAMP-binding protein|uniref:Crp/Fnr family transcriptional regulator n=1 Tax=Sphingomonas telluris TaxID=2907998 RepID=A0ABS9VK14_9SPHN|nr:Crp/Fnr family transcriptional regulator [Sphingomonas telluris]MCH8615315.1 Crp/Fnr family transcriptional regulator [Sphingomonas telluris]